MKLKALSLADLERVRHWRNESLVALRTPFLLTQEQQEQFYREVICSRQANARYWGIVKSSDTGYGSFQDSQWEPVLNYKLIGMCGLENIQWENRLAEISIILNPNYRGKGCGEKAVDLLLDQGFNYLNLENIWGECYECNKAISFWKKVAAKYNAETVTLPNRKYWQGKYYDSLYFNISKSDFGGARL